MFLLLLLPVNDFQHEIQLECKNSGQRKVIQTGDILPFFHQSFVLGCKMKFMNQKKGFLEIKDNERDFLGKKPDFKHWNDWCNTTEKDMTGNSGVNLFSKKCQRSPTKLVSESSLHPSWNETCLNTKQKQLGDFDSQKEFLEVWVTN